MKKTKEEKGRKLYISDLHLFHTAIIEKCNRPFENIYDMNRTIIVNWIAKVNRNDTVYILGDVAMYHAKDTADILNSLPGKKILITGNHDRYNLAERSFRKCFDTVSSYMEITDQGRKVVLFHYPIEEWDGYFRNFYHLHGHVHNSDSNLKILQKRFNVSADVIGFTPQTLDELIKSKPVIKDAEFISVWDGGNEITTPCKVNTVSKEIFDLKSVDAAADILEREYIRLDGSEYKAVSQDERDDPNQFWYR